MTKPVNAANRLDRLPMGAFQWRILSLIGLGMFFDGFDNQMAAGVLGALVKEGWSTMEMNAHYISITFAGLAVGALMTGLVGDRFGRRFCLSVQPADLRFHVPGFDVRAIDGMADRDAFHHGHWNRRGICPAATEWSANSFHRNGVAGRWA